MAYILVVEDDKNISTIISTYLENDGHTVDSSDKGFSGLENALNNDYDLIILDVMLPGLNGFEICKEIRNKKDIPILFVTAKGIESDIKKGFDLGADDYIIKPFNPNELVIRVNSKINRYNTITNKFSEETISFGDVTINLMERRFFKNGEEFILPNKEFELLLYLYNNKNMFLTREQIFKAIWDEIDCGDLSTVTVHIKRLRDKIEDDVKKPKYIETIWGAGYRFKI